MPPVEDETIDIDVDALFSDDTEDNNPETPPAPTATPETKAVSKRINEVRAQTERETREAMAKELGYESYAAMKQAREKKVLTDAGLDEESAKVVDKIVEQRLADDPRLKKLAAIEKQQQEAFVASQLAAINSAAGTDFKSIDQLPPETLALWEKIGDLKQAYYATQGDTIFAKRRAASENGSTAHLANPGHSGGAKTRGLTEEEKAMWRMVMPDITEEELSKKTMDVK